MTRKAIRETLKKICSQEIMWYEYDAINAACEELKSGYWEEVHGMWGEPKWICSCCREEMIPFSTRNTDPKYCPNCGARMVKENEQ